MVKLIFLVTVFVFSIYLSEQSNNFLSKEYIRSINKVAKTWKARENFFPNTSKEYIVKLLGSKLVKTVSKSQIKKKDPLYIEDYKIPSTFDARKHWKNCNTIGRVRNQGNCGSCWAFGTTGAFSDRMCVATNGTFNQLLSAQKLTFCCWKCGFGCFGGYPIKAWEYFMTKGVVTGGDYGTKEGCQPYKVEPCIIDEEGYSSCKNKLPVFFHFCRQSCYGNISIEYKQDLYKTKDAYYLTNSTMQKDIYTYGPIEASFEVYDDFPSYSSGIYQKTEGATFLGEHSVKLIGWGVENDVPFWLLVNSWGEEWGEKGLFKILRGKNECGIENEATAGVPLV